MNRRNFFKAVTGFVAGVFAASGVVKAEPKRWLRTEGEVVDARKIKVKKNYQHICFTTMESSDNCFFSVAYIIDEDGSVKRIPFQDFYKQV